MVEVIFHLDLGRYLVAIQLDKRVEALADLAVLQIFKRIEVHFSSEGSLNSLKLKKKKSVF